MTQAFLDAGLAQQLKLKTAPSALELCDPNGMVVGLFTPVKKAKIAVPFSEEEIERSKKEVGGRPLAEILADLEKA
jgi:hypothetical protein